ncbi:hypothetical protein ACB092_12G129400 [Castanea dentata]
MPKYIFHSFPPNFFSIPAKNFSKFFFPTYIFNLPHKSFISHTKPSPSLSHALATLYLTHTLGAIDHSQTHPPSRAQPGTRRGPAQRDNDTTHSQSLATSLNPSLNLSLTSSMVKQLEGHLKVELFKALRLCLVAGNS